MIKYSHISFPLAVFIFLALIALWLDQISRPYESINGKGMFHNPDYIIEGVSGIQMNHTQANRRNFSAETLSHYFEENVTRMQQVSFVNSGQGKPVFRLQADIAEIRDKNETIYLKENIIAIRGTENEKDQITLTTDFLYLIPDESMVITDHAVTISKLGSTISAIGMELDNQTGILQLLSSVKAINFKSSSK
ncbi:MAG: LPS export ABC transporter periplasmic protein LptC [Pseudomonadota bacterium]